MKSIFMRVLTCKIHCPSFICFCKPSAATHLYSPGPLKLENSPHVPSAVVSAAPDGCDQLPSTVVEEVKEESVVVDGKQEAAPNCVLRSCVKKPYSKSKPSSPKAVEKRKVQWVDNLGKELVDIKEFESRIDLTNSRLAEPLDWSRMAYAGACFEMGDSDYDDENRGCLCSIL